MGIAKPRALGVSPGASRRLKIRTERTPRAGGLFDSETIPLAVDLDGTLIKTDITWESLLALLKQNPFLIFRIPIWIVKGKAYLKQEIARRITLDVTRLPYNNEFLDFLRKEHDRGRILILTTASDSAVAERIADHLGIFAEVLASNGNRNLKGINKAKVLQEKFGYKGFDYAGNEAADLEVWARSHAAIVVNAPRRLIRQTKTKGCVTRVVTEKKDTLGALLRVIRPKHWIKNSLIFVPLITSQELTNFALVQQAIGAFVAFSLVASSVYLLNDLTDLYNDRRHHEKKNRPFASGELSLPSGLLMIPLFLFAGLCVSLILPRRFLLVLGGYFVLNVAYSLYLKRILLVDVLLLAIFYTLRVIGGSVATDIPLSNWLLVFSVFMFQSLAFAKRVSELQFLRDHEEESTRGRGYVCTDLEQLASLGAASGYIAVLVFTLYLDSPAVKELYSSTATLWIVCPLLLYWISRLWLMVHRRQVSEDPIVFVLKDKVSCFIGLAVVIALLVAG